MIQQLSGHLPKSCLVGNPIRAIAIFHIVADLQQTLVETQPGELRQYCRLVRSHFDGNFILILSTKVGCGRMGLLI